MKRFANNLKRLMRDRGLTAKAICKATGIPQSTFSEWTVGREPKLSENVIKLARYFGCSVEALITGQEPEQDIVASMIESIEDGFATVHKGVYRVRIEKYVGTERRPAIKGDVEDE